MIAEPTHASLFERFTPAAPLATFERFVQAQRPAVEPWTPVTDYSFEHRKQIEGPRPQLIKDVFNPSEVLDVGCGPGHLVRLLREIGVNAFGCDKVPQQAQGFIHCDVVEDDAASIIHPTDLVVCREVLEHLTAKQIVKAVKNLVKLSSKYIYLTTRFNQTPAHLLDVQDHDDLDPTHITLLPRDLLRLLFVLEGCRSRLDLEAKMDWGPVGRSMVFEVPA